MIDFVKIAITNPHSIKRIWHNKNLIFHSDMQRLVGDEIRQYSEKKFLGLTFTLFPDRLEIKGSLHKYFNNGIHNANDFSPLDCIRVVNELKKTFDLNFEECRIVNLEYGLNIIPFNDVKLLIEQIKYHGRNEFRYISDLQYTKLAGSFNSHYKLNEYKSIKVYAKGLQRFNGLAYGDYNTFRFEVKSKQAKYINRFGIYTLEDLTNPVVYEKLALELLKEWNEVLILDKNLPESDNRIFKYTFSDFWENSLTEHRNRFSRNKKNYFKLLSDYPKNIHFQIRDLLKNKLEIFMDELKNNANSTQLIICSSANSNSSQIANDADSTQPKTRNYADSTIVKLESAPTRLCMVTGLDISMQKPESKFLCYGGLIWLYKNKPDLYLTIKYRFLPRGGFSGKHTKYEKDEICHIAKQIRNTYNNPRRYFHKTDKNQLELFENTRDTL